MSGGLRGRTSPRPQAALGPDPTAPWAAMVIAGLPSGQGRTGQGRPASGTVAHGTGVPDRQGAACPRTSHCRGRDTPGSGDTRGPPGSAGVGCGAGTSPPCGRICPPSCRWPGSEDGDSPGCTLVSATPHPCAAQAPEQVHWVTSPAGGAPGAHPPPRPRRPGTPQQGGGSEGRGKVLRGPSPPWPRRPAPAPPRGRPLFSICL